MCLVVGCCWGEVFVMQRLIWYWRHRFWTTCTGETLWPFSVELLSDNVVYMLIYRIVLWKSLEVSLWWGFNCFICCWFLYSLMLSLSHHIYHHTQATPLHSCTLPPLVHLRPKPFRPLLTHPTTSFLSLPSPPPPSLSLPDMHTHSPIPSVNHPIITNHSGAETPVQCYCSAVHTACPPVHGVLAGALCLSPTARVMLQQTFPE